MNTTIQTSDLSLIIYDFDGVMTNNQVLVDETGKESVFCNRSDGLAIEHIQKKGIPQIIISSEKNPVVQKRAEKLSLPVIQGIGNQKKYAVVTKYCEEKNIDLRNVLYIGNDLNDLEIMKAVGYPVAPFDAYKEIKDVAKIITHARGGEGVIRELITILV